MIDGSATAALDGSTLPLEAGSWLVLPPDTEFALTTGTDRFEAMVHARRRTGRLGEGEPFTPPWAT